MTNIEPQVFNLDDLEKLAQNGDGLSTYILGRSYFSEEMDAPQNYELAVKWYRYGAEKLNDPRCIYGLGICYDDGVGGLEQDHDISNELFTRAHSHLLELANGGDPYSKFILGAYYFYGFAGVEPNKKRAFQIIYEAAMQGHLAAIYDLGVFYHDGTGAEIDYEKSKYYLEIASQAGLTRARQKLLTWKQDFEVVKYKTYELTKDI